MQSVAETDWRSPLSFRPDLHRQRSGALHHQQVDLAGDEVRHSRSGSAIGDVVELLAGQLLEENAAYIGCRILVDKLILPGFAFIQATKSFKLSVRSFLATSSWLTDSKPIGSKSFCRS